MTNATIIISLAVTLIAGLAMSRVVKRIGLPAVTGYLVAGLLIGPYCLGQLGVDGLGFVSYESVKSFDIISEVALGFIAFTIGNEFRLSDLKQIGKQAVVVGILETIAATVAVDIALIGLHFILGEDKLPMSAALILGAIASATAPAATLMVVRQYKAKGPVTSILLPIVALDDAVGLMVFELSFGIAVSLTDSVNVVVMLVKPMLEIVISIVGGGLLGYLFTKSEQFFHSRSKRLAVSVTFVFVTIGLSLMKIRLFGMELGFSSLLSCMMLGTVFCNTCDFSNELMERVDRWTAPLLILFFVLSGAELQLSVFLDKAALLIGVVYILSRCAGKYLGCYWGAELMHCDDNIRKYLGITMFPQAGVALGMSLIALQRFPGAEGLLIRNIVLFGILIYELVGPTLTKISLMKAGEIQREDRKSSRMSNTEMPTR